MYLVILHSTCGVNQDDIEVIILRCSGVFLAIRFQIDKKVVTISYGFLSDASCILSVAPLEELYTTFPIWTAYIEHS